MATTALQGNLHYSLSSNKLSKNTWIADTGASDHMACSTCSMTEYTLCDNPINILMADGTTSPAKGHGTVCISGLKLKSILHVPGLRCNLLSVHKITQDMYCCVTFFPSYCLFQNQVLGRTIGNAKAKDGLYYLTEDRIFFLLQIRLF